MLLRDDLQGIQQVAVPNFRPLRKPITFNILEKLHKEVNEAWWEHRMLWAAFTLGTIGLLRSGELALDEAEPIDSPKLLRMRNVTLESSNGRTVLKVRLFNTKTDRNNHEVQVIIGETGRTVCAVSAMCAYLRVRSSADPKTPLFIFQDGAILRRKALIIFVAAIRGTLFSSRRCFGPRRCQRTGLRDSGSWSVDKRGFQTVLAVFGWAKRTEIGVFWTRQRRVRDTKQPTTMLLAAWSVTRRRTRRDLLM